MPATAEGTAGATTNFTVSGSGLGSDDTLTLTAPTGCEISINSSSNFAGGLEFNLGSGGSLANTTIYARISASATASFSGDLYVDEANYPGLDKSISLSGTVTGAPTLIVSTTTLTLPGTTEGTAGDEQLHGQWQWAWQRRHVDVDRPHRVRDFHKQLFELCGALPFNLGSGVSLADTTIFARISASATAEVSGDLYVDDANYPGLDQSISVSGTFANTMLNVSTTTLTLPATTQARPGRPRASRSAAAVWAAATTCS